MLAGNCQELKVLPSPQLVHPHTQSLHLAFGLNQPHGPRTQVQVGETWSRL